MELTDDNLRWILASSPVIAMVGASPNPARPSNRVMKFLLDCGFDVIPVRPKVNEIMGKRCFASLDDITAKVDIVDVFRKPEACAGVARAAVAIGARILWLQEGIVSDDAAAFAHQGGLEVVMDRCIMKVIQNLGL